MNHPAPNSRLIGVFDSGVGGLSVLRALRQRQPALPLLYIADSGHAPYGDRNPAHVVERSLKVTQHLIDQGASLIVIACNTATAWAIDTLRERHPTLDLVGVEPGVKPAVALSRNRRVGVMATPSTLASERFASLLARYANDCKILGVGCRGLAAAIEQGEIACEQVDQLLDLYCAELRRAEVDTAVLGCTHYPFVAERIAQRLGPEVQLLDTADAVARQALNLWVARHPERSADSGNKGQVRLQSTGDTMVLARLAREQLGLFEPVENITL
ncbi:glutamate racemase [Ideonella azotifigens]|uniref:Glutamate racemase n=1 Tax=Ideonella azotifigens TaxID=513160 RepID=A0ABP3VF41_9BURK|nr:glutamate racemase [Ideonella azotifigens]MCD2343895.1 glutamate racemase [Ideonella azotifigens]